MTLIVFRTDKSTQKVNLSDNFILDDWGRKLTPSEIGSKAYLTAFDIAGGQGWYYKHVLDNYV